jgi:hypothetical protein
VEFAECQVLSPCQEWFFPVEPCVPQEDHRAWQILFCFEKEQHSSSAVARVDSDRQTSVVEPDLQTVRVHMVACASTSMAGRLRRLVVTLLGSCVS